MRSEFHFLSFIILNTFASVIASLYSEPDIYTLEYLCRCHELEDLSRNLTKPVCYKLPNGKPVDLNCGGIPSVPNCDRGFKNSGFSDVKELHLNQKQFSVDAGTKKICVNYTKWLNSETSDSIQGFRVLVSLWENTYPYAEFGISLSCRASRSGSPENRSSTIHAVFCCSDIPGQIDLNNEGVFLSATGNALPSRNDLPSQLPPTSLTALPRINLESYVPFEAIGDTVECPPYHSTNPLTTSRDPKLQTISTTVAPGGQENETLQYLACGVVVFLILAAIVGVAVVFGRRFWRRRPCIKSGDEKSDNSDDNGAEGIELAEQAFVDDGHDLRSLHSHYGTDEILRPESEHPFRNEFHV